MKGILKKFPEYKNREVFVTGESYAGHYVPAVSAELVKSLSDEINFVGAAIGNGWTNPLV